MTADIIRAGSLWGFCQLTRFLAYDPQELLAAVGLCESDLDNPDQFLARPTVAALLEHSAVRMECPDIGMRLAGVQDIHILGALAFAIRHAVDLRAALQTTIRHADYQSPEARMWMERDEDANKERVLIGLPEADRGEGAQMMEHFIALLCRVLRQISAGQVQWTRVTFSHAPVSSSDIYLENFGVAPEFNMPASGITMDRRDLALPLTTANQALHSIIERYLELNTPASGDSAERQVRQALVEIMRNGEATIGDVSDMLKVHPRTLQRRLTEAGTTVGKVRDDVRKQMAEMYLANKLVPLAHVAQLLGYANQSVLTRSCLRWFGCTPLAMRHQIMAQAA